MRTRSGETGACEVLTQLGAGPWVPRPFRQYAPDARSAQTEWPAGVLRSWEQDPRCQVISEMVASWSLTQLGAGPRMRGHYRQGGQLESCAVGSRTPDARLFQTGWPVGVLRSWEQHPRCEVSPACAAREETRVQMDRDASCPGPRRPRRLGCKVHRRHGPRNRTAGTHPQVCSRANDLGHAQIETGRARRQAKVQREQTEKVRPPTFKGHGEHGTRGRTVSVWLQKLKTAHPAARTVCSVFCCGQILSQCSWCCHHLCVWLKTSRSFDVSSVCPHKKRFHPFTMSLLNISVLHPAFAPQSPWTQTTTLLTGTEHPAQATPQGKRQFGRVANSTHRL